MRDQIYVSLLAGIVALFYKKWFDVDKQWQNNGKNKKYFTKT